MGTVLLHGFLGSGKNLRTLATRFAERAPSRVFLLPDLPGHGTSPEVSPTTDLREMGAAVLATARAEGLDGALDFVGHSLGGRVALGASLVEPGSVRSVVLLDIAPSPIPTDESESGKVLQLLLSAPAEATDRRELRAFLVDRGLSGPIADWLMMNVEKQGATFRWRFDRAALGELHRRVNREDLWEAVERPGADLLCVRGGESSYVSDADAQRLQRAGARVETLPGVGHFVHVDGLEPLLGLLGAT